MLFHESCRPVGAGRVYARVAASTPQGLAGRARTAGLSDDGPVWAGPIEPTSAGTTFPLHPQAGGWRPRSPHRPRRFRSRRTDGRA